MARPRKPEPDYNEMWRLIKDIVHEAGFELADVRGTDGNRRSKDRRLIDTRQRITYILYKEADYTEASVADFLHCTLNAVYKRATTWKKRLGAGGATTSK